MYGGFGSGWGLWGEGFARSCWKLPLCQIETMPAGSKTDLLLAKAKAINNSGRTSVIKYLITRTKPNLHNLWTHGERSPHWSQFDDRIWEPMGHPF